MEFNTKEYNTDKIGSGILEEYVKMFSHLENKSISMLEIGYLDGEFLRWFKDQFKKAHVFGIGINPPGELKDCERTTLLQADQNDMKALLDIKELYQRFDIIIDDGAHRDKETRNSFNCLWSTVKAGGWYCIEDWGAHYQHLEYGDMGKVISHILINKESLGISNMKITCKANFTSLACFQKKL